MRPLVALLFATSFVAFEAAVVNVAFDGLLTPERSAESLREGLRKDGIVAISGIAGLAEAKIAAFRTAAHASVGAKAGLGESQDSPLPDGSVRKSFHARGRGAGEEAFGGGDDLPEIAAFRGIVDRAVDAIFGAVDDAFGFQQQPGSSSMLRNGVADAKASRRAPQSPRTTFRELGTGESGEQLEHFHVYSTAKEAPPEAMSLGLHADAGLFVVFSPGMYWDWDQDGDMQLCHALPMEDFEFEDRNGHRQNLKGLGMDSLLVMVGDGAEKWLNPSFPEDKRLKTALHQLKVAKDCPLRTWYGRMYLPKQDTWLPEEGATFGAVKQKAAAAVRKLQAEGRTDVSPLTGSFAEVGCDLGEGRGLAVSHTQGCKADEFYCWATCMKQEDYHWQCSVDKLVCLNNDTNKKQSGSEMHGHAECTSKSKSTSSSSRPFCIGSGTSMIMTGFKSFIFHKNTPPCVMFLYSGFVMDSKWKLFVGCLLSLALGIVVEVMTWIRRGLRVKGQFGGAPILPELKTNERALNTILGILYGAQVTLAYYAMLLAMTYCSEIFASLVLGLILGHCWFNIDSPIAENCDPCCVSAPVQERSGTGYTLLPGDPREAQADTCRYYSVQGMTCEGCERAITNALSGVHGVDPTTVKVELENRSARIGFMKDSTHTEAQIEDDCMAAVSAAGYHLERTERSWRKNK